MVDAEARRLIRVVEVDPRIQVELRYATVANFVGRRLYASAEAWLCLGTARKLRTAQDRLAPQGMVLKVWDAYRPPSAQRELWRCRPDPAYVAPPERGSRHSRGTAVDVTLVDASGAPLSMPSDFDEFGPSARRDYAGGTEVSRRHRDRLIEAMEAAGFTGITSEWWHFDDTDWREYPLLDHEG